MWRVWKHFGVNNQPIHNGISDSEKSNIAIIPSIKMSIITEKGYILGYGRILEFCFKIVTLRTFRMPILHHPGKVIGRRSCNFFFKYTVLYPLVLLCYLLKLHNVSFM